MDCSKVETPAVSARSKDFGLSQADRINFGTSTFIDLLSINPHVQICITSTNTFRLQDNEIKEKSKVTLSCGVYVKDHDLVIGISPTNTRFIILSARNLSLPLSDSIPSGQIGVFKMHYFPKSSSLVLFSKEIQVWSLIVKPPLTRFAPMTFEITYSRTLHSNFEFSFLSPPPIDTSRETIYVSTQSGYNEVSIHDPSRRQFINFPQTPQTPTDSSETFFLAASPDLLFFNKSGLLEKKINLLSMSVIFARFINSEFILILDKKLNIYFVHFYTSKFYLVGKLKSFPMTGYVIYDRFYVSVDSTLQVYDINIPFKLWATVKYPLQLKRVNKLQNAARIAVRTGQSCVELFSPRDRTHLNVASSTDQLVSFFYDRVNTDRLFLLYDNYFDVYTTGSVPCTLLTSVQGRTIGIFRFGDMYYAVNSNGDIVLYSFERIEMLKRHVVLSEKVLSACQVAETNVFLLQTNNEVVICEGVNIRTRTEMQPGLVHATGLGLYIVGGNRGRLSVIKIDGLEKIDTPLLGNGKVNSVAFGWNFIVSGHEDGLLRFWSDRMEYLACVSLPFRVHCIEILNGTGSVLVGTEGEVMIIDSGFVFESNNEAEREDIDNFDRKVDILRCEGLLSEEEREEEGESLLKRNAEETAEDGHEEEENEEEEREKLKVIVTASERRRLLNEMLEVSKLPVKREVMAEEEDNEAPKEADEEDTEQQNLLEEEAEEDTETLSGENNEQNCVDDDNNRIDDHNESYVDDDDHEGRMDDDYNKIDDEKRDDVYLDGKNWDKNGEQGVRDTVDDILIANDSQIVSVSKSQKSFETGAMNVKGGLETPSKQSSRGGNDQSTVEQNKTSTRSDESTRKAHEERKSTPSNSHKPDFARITAKGSPQQISQQNKKTVESIKPKGVSPVRKSYTKRQFNSPTLNKTASNVLLSLDEADQSPNNKMAKHSLQSVVHSPTNSPRMMKNTRRAPLPKLESPRRHPRVPRLSLYESAMTPTKQNGLQHRTRSVPVKKQEKQKVMYRVSSKHEFRSPPIIRLRRRPRTPSPRKLIRRPFLPPAPNIVLDKEVVIQKYLNGQTEYYTVIRNLNMELISASPREPIIPIEPKSPLPPAIPIEPSSPSDYQPVPLEHIDIDDSSAVNISSYRSSRPYRKYQSPPIIRHDTTSAREIRGISPIKMTKPLSFSSPTLNKLIVSPRKQKISIKALGNVGAAVTVKKLLN